MVRRVSENWKMLLTLPTSVLVFVLVQFCTCPETETPTETSEVVKAPKKSGIFLNAKFRLLDDASLMFEAHRLCGSYRHKYEEAILYYNEAIKRKPSKANRYASRGQCYLEAKNTKMALSDLRTAISLSSNPQKYQSLLCETLFNTGNLDEARRGIFSKESAQLDYYYLTELAINLCRKEELAAEGLLLLGKAIEKEPYERFYRARGRCHSFMRNREMAITDFKAAVSVPADYADNDTRELLIQTLLDAKNFDEATKEMQRLSIGRLAELGDVSKAYHRFEEAILFYTEIIKKDPNSFKSYNSRGCCYIKLGDMKKALEDFDRIFELDQRISGSKKHYSGKLFLTAALFGLGNIQEAQQEMLAFDEYQLMTLADHLLTKKSYHAGTCYTEAVNKNPNNIECYKKRAQYYKGISEKRKAKSDYEKILELDSTCVDCWIDLAEILFEMYNFEECKKVLKDINKKFRNIMERKMKRIIELRTRVTGETRYRYRMAGMYRRGLY